MRLNPPRPDEYSEEQQTVHDEILQGPRGRVRGPLALWPHRPQLARHAQALGEYCRYGSSLPPMLSEIAVLALASIWRAELPWYSHQKDAIDHGVDVSVIEALRRHEEPDFKDEAALAVYRVVTELVKDRVLSEQTYHSALGLIGKDGMVDLIGIIGYYTMIAMTVTAFDLPLPEGVAKQFA